MNVVVDGLMTSYRKSGSGKPVVFLHGWGDNQDSFDNLVTFLGDEYQVLSVDLPGFGGTQPPDKAWSLYDYSNFVKEWLIKIDQTNVYALVGHSFGGSIAIKGLSSSTLQADKLVLLAASGVRENQTTKKKLLKLIAACGKAATSFFPAAQKRKIRRGLYKKIGSDSMLVPHMEDTYRTIISEDLREKAGDVRTKTLLIYGDQDKITPPSEGRILGDRITGSQLEILSGLGHFLHQQSPEAVALKIEEFLNESI